MSLMNREETIERIERYLLRNDAHPRLVNVNNPEDFLYICQHFQVGENVFKNVSDFSAPDENYSEEKLDHFLEESEGDLFLTGFTSYYRLLGERELQNFLNAILGKSLSGLHLVLICYQCEKYLSKAEPRYQQFLYLADGPQARFPQLTFVAPATSVAGGGVVIDGIQNLAYYIESRSAREFIIKTGKHTDSYPLSLYAIREVRDSFELLCLEDPATEQLKKEYGSAQEWDNALPIVERYGSWAQCVNAEFGNTTNLSQAISNWKSYDSKKKWLYFIALKLYGVENSWCLNEAVKQTSRADLFVMGIFRSILDLPHDDRDFWRHYDERKNLINMLGNCDIEVKDYCDIVQSKGKDMLYYLTDATSAEKHLIFESLAKYSEEIGRAEVMHLLSHIYPDLYSYLQPYSFGIPLLDDYFGEYKYQKVVNQVFPEFLETVNEQAVKREYNLLLPLRSEKLDAIEKNGTIVYFVDAMGVEYLSYILSLCNAKQLMAEVTVCRCELPSITSRNKEFVEILERGGAVFAPDKNGIKSLDDLKHHGAEEFDYTNNAYPTYIARELEIIREVIEKIEVKLRGNECQRVIMLSDHGASRLSVLTQSETKWGSESNAEHSGRCCPVSEIAQKPPCATEENGYWVLANYDRFKGSRKANVEVHGGASLEEVAVPIIEISYAPEAFDIRLQSQTVKFGRRKPAAIRIVSKKKLDSLSVRIVELKREYSGISDDGQNFTFELTDLRKAGTYSVDVYLGDNLLKQGLSFTAVNTDFGEKKIL